MNTQSETAVKYSTKRRLFFRHARLAEVLTSNQTRVSARAPVSPKPVPVIPTTLVIAWLTRQTRLHHQQHARNASAYSVIVRYACAETALGFSTAKWLPKGTVRVCVCVIKHYVMQT